MKPISTTRATLAVAACALAALAVPAEAGARALIASGTLTDAHGLPTSGTVSLYAWPHEEGRARLPLLARGKALSGGFAVRAREDERLLRLARKRQGWIDFLVHAETTASRGEWTFSGFVRRDGRGGVQVLSSEAALGSGRAASASASSEPRIRLRADEPLMARAAQEQRCRPDRETRTDLYRNWAVVGELNNAYNDGTTAQFTYGEDKITETHFGVAQVIPGAKGKLDFVIEGENTISEQGRVHFAPVRRRYSRRLYSYFEFERTKVRMTRCSAWDTYVMAKQWIDGGQERRQRGMLDRCIAEALGGFPGARYEFDRYSSNAVRWKRGASAFGVFLTTRSGFSEHVQTHQTFGGRRANRHYLCGKDGTTSPYTAGRIASGARQVRPTAHNPGR